jgi:hypothetical protein
VAATALVAVAGLLYGLDRAGVDVPGGGSARGLSAMIFVLGFVACITGADPEAFAPTTPRINMFLNSVLGTTTLAAGVIAMTTGSTAWQTVLLVAMLVLWVVTTIHRALSPRRAEVAPSTTTEREKVGAS